MSAYGRSDIEQAVVNARKVARSMLRLKHSIAADNELNDVMPRIEAYLAQQVAKGYVPELTGEELLKLVEGDGK
jgi:uncharacterized protein YccT (UPF0319 family)